MSDTLEISQRYDETPSQEMARLTLTPECLSAAVLADSKLTGDVPVTEVVDELRRQTAAINRGDMTRAENMLLAQAHTLDGLFALLTSRAMHSNHFSNLESYMRLALKTQNQARATLQTLAELKAPKQVSFVRQANIGNQVQVNNGMTEQPTRTRNAKKTPNELLETTHEQRLDTRAQGSTGSADQTMATVEAQHRPNKPRR